MARNRMLNPDFWLDEELAAISPHARLLYQGLWGICDDNNATFPNRPEWVKAQVFPYEKVDIRRLLDELSKIGKILLFQDENAEFWYIKNFFKYQRVDRPSKEKYPVWAEAKMMATRQSVAEHSTSTRTEVKLSKDKLSKVKISEVTPALVEKRFTKLSEITDLELQAIATKYAVPESFVASKLEDLSNWHEMKPQKNHYANYYRALCDWVKRDSLKIRKEVSNGNIKRGVDARNIE